MADHRAQDRSPRPCGLIFRRWAGMTLSNSADSIPRTPITNAFLSTYRRPLLLEIHDGRMVVCINPIFRYLLNRLECER